MHDVTILVGDAVERMRELREDSVHIVVTSPPYWGQRDYGVQGQIGLESSLAEHIEALVRLFAEVRRVLRPDGVVWLNYGDAYGQWGTGNAKRSTIRHGRKLPDGAQSPRGTAGEFRHKDLIGIPWRLAFALQADGWYVRSSVIWSKPNPVPEEARDRPARSYEYVFLLSPGPKYYYDSEAVRVPAPKPEDPAATRNLRDVWSIPTEPFPDGHFATFPAELARRCILASTSEHGACPKCGRQLERIRAPDTGGSIGRAWHDHSDDVGAGNAKRGGAGTYRRGKTLGWQAGCDCGTESTIPAVVLDPFGGAGTTALAAVQSGRDAILCELNPEYAQMARVRLLTEVPMLAAVSVLERFENAAAATDPEKGEDG